VSPMTGSIKSMVIGQVNFDVNKVFAVSLLDRSLSGSPGILYFCARSSKISTLVRYFREEDQYNGCYDDEKSRSLAPFPVLPGDNESSNQRTESILARVRFPGRPQN
jgi:hypothetical protein